MYPLKFLVGANESGESTVEITAKTLQGRFLLKPDSHVASIIAGVLARAKQRYGVKIHGHVALSTHMHLIITVNGVKMMSRFMQYVMSNVARKLGRYFGWSGKFWQRRYRSIEINRDEESLLGRFDYILRHGTKEGLVRCPTEWPGLHCAWNYASGEWTVRGHWDDQTRAYRMRAAGKRVRREDCRSRQSFELDPLPCWEGVDRSVVTKWVRERLEMIREEYRHLPFLGLKKLAAQNIYDEPKTQTRKSAPMFHCKDKERWSDMLNAYREFVKSFYAASGRLNRLMRAEKEPYCFPSGCQPPLPPVVPESA